MADPWDWQDECFKLDSESPLEITRCLWDELPRNEEDCRSLFSTPLADIATHDPPFYSIRGQNDPAETFSQRYCYSGDLNGGGDTSPRTKRRRVLFCEPDPVYDNGCDAHAESYNLTESYTNCIDPLALECSSGLQQCVDVNSLASADAFWYRQCDDMSAPFGGAVDPGSHNWMIKSFEDDESHVANENSNMKIELPVWSAAQPLSHHEREGDAIQGPATPLPGRSTSFNNNNNNKLPAAAETRKPPLPQPSPSTPYPKVSTTPVAYPFTLLKPSETEGDITLKDINQRILMPPSRPVPHLQKQQHHQQAMMDDNSWSPTDQGLGLSGKSIVARTKIHTEGNGTITIMRTRG